MCVCVFLTILYISWIKAFQETIWFSPLTADHYIVAWLVPKVIPKRQCIALSLPVTSNFKWLTIKENKSTYYYYYYYYYCAWLPLFLLSHPLSLSLSIFSSFSLPPLPFAFPSGSPIVLIITCPLAKQCDVCGMARPVFSIISLGSTT